MQPVMSRTRLSSSSVSEQFTEMVARPDRSLSPVLQPEFAQNGLHVHFNRRLGDDQLARDDLVRRPFRERSQNHQLAARQASDHLVARHGLLVRGRAKIGDTPKIYKPWWEKSDVCLAVS